MYKALVRTHLEYASSVWAPYTIHHIRKLESVQRRATKQLPGLKDLSYAERLKSLKLPTLSFHRVRGDMIEVYKIMNNLYDQYASNDILITWESQVDRTSRGNSKKLYLTRSNTKIRKHSFAIRVVETWNHLPDSIVNAPSLNTFKNRFDKFFNTHPLLYDDFLTNPATTTTYAQPDNAIYNELCEEAY